MSRRQWRAIIRFVLFLVLVSYVFWFGMELVDQILVTGVGGIALVFPFLDDEDWKRLFALSVMLGGFLYLFSRRFQAIRKRDEIEKELKMAKEACDITSQAKSDFITGMSHELLSPLNAVMGYAQLLDGDLAVDRKAAVRQILAGGNQLIELIHSLLDLSKVEAGEVGFELEPMLPDVEVSVVTDLLRNLAAERKISIQNDLTAGGTGPLIADRIRFRQIIMNLVSNAIKYNKEGGSVRLTREDRAGGMVRIMVRDTGVGITASHLERVFEPFVRVAESASSVGGTGIGLSLCQFLVQGMGGAVGARSKPGEGSVFWFELPSADSRLGSVSDQENGLGRRLKLLKPTSWFRRVAPVSKAARDDQQ